MIRTNMIFASMGSGAGVVPFKEEPNRNWDLVELLWKPSDISAHERGERPHLGAVICDPSRDKRKLWNFGEAWNAGVIPRDRAAYAILDDDLTPTTSWNNIFDLFHESKFAIAQPALTPPPTGPNSPPESTKHWAVTTQEADLLWRHTDFVEVMAPIIRGDLVERMVRHFLDEPNGWGIEAYWAHCFAPIGILDAAPIIHTRPIASAGSLGHWGLEECERMADEYRRKHHLTSQTKIWPGHTIKRVYGTAAQRARFIEGDV